jgi:hypothetical protein
MSALRTATMWCSGRKLASTGDSALEWKTSDPVSAMPHAPGPRPPVSSAPRGCSSKPVQSSAARSAVRLHGHRRRQPCCSQIGRHRGRQVRQRRDALGAGGDLRRGDARDEGVDQRSGEQVGADRRQVLAAARRPPGGRWRIDAARPSAARTRPRMSSRALIAPPLAACITCHEGAPFRCREIAVRRPRAQPGHARMRSRRG